MKILKNRSDAALSKEIGEFANRLAKLDAFDRLTDEQRKRCAARVISLADEAGATMAKPIGNAADLKANEQHVKAALDSLQAQHGDSLNLFSERQLEVITGTSEAPKPGLLLFRDFVPDRTLDRGAESFTEYLVDGDGEGEYAKAHGRDSMPMISVRGGALAKPLHEFQIGLKWDISDEEAARMAGFDALGFGMRIAARAHEREWNHVAIWGRSDWNLQGMFGLAGSNNYQSPNNGTGSSRDWTTKTPALILADLVTLIHGGTNASRGVDTVDRVVLPLRTYLYMAVTQNSAASDITILEYAQRAFPGVSFDWSWELQTAGEGRYAKPAPFATTAPALAYKYGNEVAEFCVSIAFEASSALQVEPFSYKIGTRTKYGGIRCMRPQAISVMRDVGINV